MEHLLGKRKFFKRIKFHEKGKLYQVSVMEGKSISSSSNERHGDLEMEIAIDGEKVAHVKHLQWKVRGNVEIKVGGGRLEVYWDVYDWLFGSGPRHGLFIFRPIISTEKPPYPTPVLPLPVPTLSEEEKTFWTQENMASSNSLPGFTFFTYAWKTY